MLLTLTACGRPLATAGTIEVEISADGNSEVITVLSGSTVQGAIEASGIEIRALDRIDPPGYTLLQDGTLITISRVDERFEIEEVIIPFQRQSVRNEALPEGETRLLQPGENGVQEVTYRVVTEQGAEISRTPVKNTIIKDPVPEIIMIGSEIAHTPIPTGGRLVYVSGGNAWLIEGNSGNRKAVVVTGDLDGRILRVSPDRRWLLFSRTESEEDVINSLWIQSLTDIEADPVPLGIENVVHFADWAPEYPSLTITYSTVESSPAPPGWQANNDLYSLRITSAGRPGRPEEVIEANAGGQYGWWGTSYAWGWEEAELAYLRADGIGMVDFENGELVQLKDIVPFQTLGDWAWVPDLAWSHDGQTLYYVDHGAPVGIEDPQASPVFDLIASSGSGATVLLEERTGMFAYPTVSPLIDVGTVEIAFHLAFLKAISPLESGDSSYKLFLADRDGSNQREIFPPVGEPGLEPSKPAWSPDGDQIAVIYRGDLWVIDVVSGIGTSLTGDQQTIAVDWE